MAKIKSIVKKVENKIRRLRFRRRSKHLLNRDVTILSNTCIAGVVYNTLNLPFLSPTINLSFLGMSFVFFIEHLDDYLKNGYFVDLHKKIGYYFGPYSLLKCEGLPDLEIVFTHYRTFDEAVSIWQKRSKRINWNKIFLLIEARYENEINNIDNYLSLPYPKAIITNNSVSNSNEAVKNLSFYDNYGKEKSVTEFVSFFGRRGIDEYDFVNDIFNKDNWS